MAGLHKHKWSYTVKYAPDHFGHNWFAPPNRTITRRWINVGDVSSIAEISKKGETIDLGSMGFDKLLGQGSVSSPLILKVPRASGSAIEKIKAAGGSVEIEKPRDAKPQDTSKSSKTDQKKESPAAKI
jgi:large subunit ribosomal protein L15